MDSDSSISKKEIRKECKPTLEKYEDLCFHAGDAELSLMDYLQGTLFALSDAEKNGIDKENMPGKQILDNPEFINLIKEKAKEHPFFPAGR